MMDDESVVIERELALLSPQVRSSDHRLRELLAPGCTEVGASGRLWTREEMISMLLAATRTDEPTTSCSEMASRRLGDDLVLLTYVTDVDGRRARRSSLWRRHDPDGWQLVHHQGTPLP